MLPPRDLSTDGIDNSCDLVSGNARILDSRPVTLFRQRIAVAQAASLNSDANLPRTWLRNLSLHHFKRSARARHQHCTHFRHGSHTLPVPGPTSDGVSARTSPGRSEMRQPFRVPAAY